MTASTLAEQVAAARESVTDSLLDGFGQECTFTPAGGQPRTVWAKVRPSRELRRVGVKTDDQESIDAQIRRDEAHATQPGVENLPLKSTLLLADGRQFTFHGKVLHENPVRRVIVFSRDLPVQMGRR